VNTGRLRFSRRGGFSLLKYTLSLSSRFSEFLPCSAEQRLFLGELAQCCDLLRIQLGRNLAWLNSGCSEMIRRDVVQDNTIIPGFHRLCFSTSELFPTYVTDLLSLPLLFLAVGFAQELAGLLRLLSSVPNRSTEGRDILPAAFR
jgi:hypothetical protein